ncbi:MAG: aminotransferase class V-fold PLP-dependent enzyme [Clostridium sp.]|nr:aminotransferase class V-fold PLP-dependent enzyme [Clostridium sp.]MDY3827792.1 aminotransferase class V-fold PLP-dependent enzyme [Clostridium sp.]
MSNEELFAGIDSLVYTLNNKKVKSINFDNAATTPPLKCVLDEIVGLSNYYASIGRGVGQKAEITTRLYNMSREYLLNYFNVKEKEKYTVVYVANTTDGINKLSRILIKSKKDMVLSTRMEHHSNDLPWRKVCNVEYVEVDEKGRLLIDDLEYKLLKYKDRIKYVTVTGASNVTGYKNDIHNIAKVVHSYGAKLIVDGAQLVPHVHVDISGSSKDEQIDFLVFSAHKLYAPFGAGAIIGLKEEFNNTIFDNQGGGTVSIVNDKSVTYLDSPERNEAGTPNFFGVIAMVTALKKIESLDLKLLEKEEKLLKKKLIDGLRKIPKVRIYGDYDNIEDSLGITVFNIDSIYHENVANILAKNYGIAVRQGWFCAHPYCRRLMHLTEKAANAFIHDVKARMPGMIRVSFGIYNNEREVETFLNAINEISRFYG